MEEQLFCRRCLNPIEQKRDDKQFCSDRCAAAWAREQGYYRTRFHAEKPEWIKKNCEWCQTVFEYNEYAMRGGQRVPKFCSNKCRQAAYRARKEEAGQHAGYTGHWDDARNEKTETKGTSQKNRRSSKGTQQPPEWNTPEQQRAEQEAKEKVRNEERAKHSQNKGTSQPPVDKRWKSKDAYEILGVTYLTSYDSIKKAWRKLLRTYHPDISTDPNASAISKAINWAWDRIEKSHPKK